MRPDDRTRVAHMVDACDEIARFLAGRAEGDLETDRMLLFAVVRALEVVGEAANGVSTDTQDKAPDVPWRLVAATRNRLIHGYFDVDPEIVWRTASEEVPKLLPALKRLLAELG